MARSLLRRRYFSAVAMLATAALFTGCNGGTTTGPAPEGGTSLPAGGTLFLSMGTAPIGGTFPIVGDAIAQTLNTHKGDNNWKVQAKGTKGSQANIRGLVKGDQQIALSNSAISYFAFRGESTWDQKYDIRAVVTMAPNVAMFVTKADSGIKSIADLKGKRVVIGPAGAGFEMFVAPILEEHGVKLTEINAVNAPQGPAVDMLADGAADAAFLGGAVPAAAISQACASFETSFVPFDPVVRQRLIDKYPFFHAFTIPGNTYQGHETAFDGLNVGSMHLITSASADEELIYQLTKTIWENRAEIASKHGAGKAINEKNAARYTGTEFHPGAIRFYKEAGVWPESEGGESADAAPAEVKPAAKEEKPAAEKAAE
ncbi:MAG: TAXI family TRAP transporter solute-binding subunit [Rhodopirellula sp.]|nr:TAXI family TRAP transporter solute-binding subunit [Rhodopirellula sp.]